MCVLREPYPALGKFSLSIFLVKPCIFLCSLSPLVMTKYEKKGTSLQLCSCFLVGSSEAFLSGLSESGSSLLRVKSARVNSARSTRPVWGPKYGGRMVRLEGGCFCMSICLSVNTYLNFSATLEVSSRESLMHGMSKVFQSCA